MAQSPDGTHCPPRAARERIRTRALARLRALGHAEPGGALLTQAALRRRAAHATAEHRRVASLPERTGRAARQHAGVRLQIADLAAEATDVVHTLRATKAAVAELARLAVAVVAAVDARARDALLAGALRIVAALGDAGPVEAEPVESALLIRQAADTASVEEVALAVDLAQGAGAAGDALPRHAHAITTLQRRDALHALP